MAQTFEIIKTPSCTFKIPVWLNDYEHTFRNKHMVDDTEEIENNADEYENAANWADAQAEREMNEDENNIGREELLIH